MELFTAHLPPDLLASMRQHAGGAAWPIATIPAVIEACRTANLVSLGGDLQVATPNGLWESPNVGVEIFRHELSMAHGSKADAAGAIALEKFISLGDQAFLLSEAVAGIPAAAEWPQHQLLQRLYFSWTVVSA